MAKIVIKTKDEIIREKEIEDAIPSREEKVSALKRQADITDNILKALLGVEAYD